MTAATRLPRKVPVANLGKAAIPPVLALELGISFTLFRRASLDEEVFVDDPFRPLSDRYANASFTEHGFRRGMSILKIHYNQPDTANAQMNRIRSFVEVMRVNIQAADPAWIRFRKMYDRFVPVVYAIAWCPVLLGEPFEPSAFIRIAASAPLSLDHAVEHHKLN